MNEAKNILKKYFGYENFRPGQDTLIEHILNGEDVLGIMPTGSGKSICYQIPAMILNGITIVISPLISLMKDQVDTLNEMGIPATYINSTLSYHNYEQTIENILNNVYKIIYVAPERLNSDTFLNLLNRINISMFTIDEAHCVSQWGHDFRPSYREISNVILSLKKRPIISAFTATATQIVKEDIINLLHLNNPFSLTTGFDRQNLKFLVEVPNNKLEFITNYVEKNINNSGIIYCLTRKNVDYLFEELLELGYSVSKYHGGMTEKQRNLSQDDFTYDRTQIMIATNAFGMGIDKSNIRYVIHYNMPKDLESYYQEAGRSGRDGEPSECILLFSRADIVANKFLIESVPSENHSQEYDKLNDIVDYCNTDKCLRKYILEYFDEVPTFENCGNCSNCLSETQLTDITSDSQKILSCIKRMKERFGSGVVTDVLKGSRTQRIRNLGFDKLSTYGIMKDYSKDTIKDLIYYLITEGYIKSIGDKYPILVLDFLANEVLFNGKHVFIKKKIEKIEHNVKSENSFDLIPDYDENLFNILRNLRKEIAEVNNIPPFVVFSDSSLRQMSTYYPIDAEKMLAIDGVGLNKLVKYGNDFIEVISNYVTKNNIKVPENSASSKKRTKQSNKEKEKKRVKKEDTRIVSYNLYVSGKSIDEIAAERGLTRITIENHLISCLDSGMEISIEKDIHTEFKEEIVNAIQEIGIEKLRPLKDALGEQVSYLDIRYYISKLKISKEI